MVKKLDAIKIYDIAESGNTVPGSCSGMSERSYQLLDHFYFRSKDKEGRTSGVA